MSVDLANDPAITIYSTGGNRTQQVYNVYLESSGPDKQIAEMLLLYEPYILQLDSSILDTVTNLDVSGLSPYKPASLILNSADPGLTGMDNDADIGKSSATLNAQFMQLGSLTSDIVKSQAMIRFGTNTSTQNINTVAEGYGSLANGFASHAAGIDTISGGTGCFVEGFQNITYQLFSHLEGGINQALSGVSGTLQSYQHLEGLGNISYGEITHTEGLDNVNLGADCHTEGSDNLTTGLNCHAEGKLTISGYGSLVSDIYNVIQTDYTQFVLASNSVTNLTKAYARTPAGPVQLPAATVLSEVPYNEYDLQFIYQPYTQNNVSLMPVQTLSTNVTISFDNTPNPTYTLNGVDPISTDYTILNSVLSNSSAGNVPVFYFIYSDNSNNYCFQVLYDLSAQNLVKSADNTWTITSVTATDINPTSPLANLSYAQSAFISNNSENIYYTPYWAATMIEYPNQVFLPTNTNINLNSSIDTSFIIYDATINLYGTIGTLLSVASTEPNYAYNTSPYIYISYPYCLNSNNTIPNQSLLQANILNFLLDGEIPTVFKSYNVHLASTEESNTHTEGLNTTAIGMNAHAEGNANLSLGDNSHTEGYNNIAYGADSHAEGTYTVACGIASHAEGAFTKAEGDNTHAEGYGTTSGLESAHAEGQFTFAAGLASHAEGSYTQAVEANTHAEGYGTIAVLANAHAEGYNTLAYGFASHVEGINNSASGTGTHVEGFNNTDLGIYDHTENINNNVNGYSCHFEGINNNVTNGTGLHVEGYSNLVTAGQYSHIEGDSNQLVGFLGSSHIEGYHNSVGGTVLYTHIEGSSHTISVANIAHIEGYAHICNSNNYGMHIEGSSNLANVSCSFTHLEGTLNTGNGTGGHLEGYSNIDNGYYNHIEGMNNIGGGTGNHIEGYSNTVTGQYCHASGQLSTITANNVFAWNDGQDGIQNYATPYTFNVHATGAFFSNNVNVGGNFSAVSKTFRIEHPLDPKKELIHFCAESDEVLNFYKGSTICDANGEAVVTLPKYVDAININYTYQLTAVGAPCLPYLKEELQNHQFVIGGGKLGIRIDWLLTGIRNDAYLRSHPEYRSVEVTKT